MLTAYNKLQGLDAGGMMDDDFLARRQAIQTGDQSILAGLKALAKVELVLHPPWRESERSPLYCWTSPFSSTSELHSTNTPCPTDEEAGVALAWLGLPPLSDPGRFAYCVRTHAMFMRILGIGAESNNEHHLFQKVAALEQIFIY
jgi:hypothetical protein